MSMAIDETIEPILDDSWSRLLRDARACRLGTALIAAGWWHLLIFLACEALFARGDRAAAHYLPLWFADALFAFVVVRCRFPALDRVESGASVRVGLRIWITFAILCFTSASLNSLTGFEVDWFKISWCLLGTFGFAMMAWVFHLAFLALAVQMSLTATLIAAHPDHAYALFGASWCLALNALGWLLERNRIAPSAR